MPMIPDWDDERRAAERKKFAAAKKARPPQMKPVPAPTQADLAAFAEQLGHPPGSIVFACTRGRR